MGGLELTVDNKTFVKNLTAFNRAISSEARKSIHRIGKRIVSRAKLNLVKNDTGTLKKSIGYRVDRAGSVLTMTAGTNVDHAIFVHEGTKPHWPNRKSILAWVHRKFPKYRSDLKKKKSLAFLVSRKIAKYGTEANPFLKDAFDNEARWIKGEVKSIVGRAKRKVGLK